MLTLMICQEARQGTVLCLAARTGDRPLSRALSIDKYILYY